MSEPTTIVKAVYVHAPFCARRCSYCDFAVTVRKKGGQRLWLDALGRELQIIEQEGLFGLAHNLSSIYVGGGTPSLFGLGAMEGLGRLLGQAQRTGNDLEWTAEANPESLTHELIVDWRKAGVNRVSIGIQSFDDDALRWMGRLHGSEGAISAVKVCKEVGLSNLSVDLIFGLPRGLGRSWERDLDLALELEVPHISLYGLTVEPNTPLGRAVADGKQPPLDDELYREEFLIASGRLSEAGYLHYEVSNFAHPNHAARHNAVYWSDVPYLGLGNGAHSYSHPIRRWNVREWEEYYAHVKSGSSPEEGREEITVTERSLERVWLSLRTLEGVSLAQMTSNGENTTEAWVRDGLAVRLHNRIRLTPLGWLELDRLALEIESVLPH